MSEAPRNQADYIIDCMNVPKEHVQHLVTAIQSAFTCCLTFNPLSPDNYQIAFDPSWPGLTPASIITKLKEVLRECDFPPSSQTQFFGLLVRNGEEYIPQKLYSVPASPNL